MIRLFVQLIPAHGDSWLADWRHVFISIEEKASASLSLSLLNQDTEEALVISDQKVNFFRRRCTKNEKNETERALTIRHIDATTLC